ncbi:unnamed protein product [Linum trigynum]|uniref:Exocyst subunit Exo70 family protein n=1 Tax=Linum trigynum TaxID=586398 RepID=A0AAV2DKG1_9ROSI
MAHCFPISSPKRTLSSLKSAPSSPSPLPPISSSPKRTLSSPKSFPSSSSPSPLPPNSQPKEQDPVTNKMAHCSPISSPKRTLSSLKSVPSSPSPSPHPPIPSSPKRTLSSPQSFPSSSSPSPLPPSPLHRTFSASMMEEDIQNAASIISRWDIENSSSAPKFSSLFHHDRRKEAKEFLKSINDLRQSIRLLKSQYPDTAKLIVHCQKLIQMAMTRLEKEFHHILSTLHDQLHPEYLSHYSAEEEKPRAGHEESVLILNHWRIPKAAMSDLKSIAASMTSAGYAKECLETYILVRRSIVDKRLFFLLGVEHFHNPFQVERLNPEALDSMIKNWLNAASVAVKTLFTGEKNLCDHVFSASERTRELCFSEVVKEAAANLFRFPELVTRNKNLKDDKIFLLMDLHEALFDLWPEIESMFGGGSTSNVKRKAHSSLLRLGESVRQTLSEFESTLQREYSSKDIVPGGGIHPLTRSVMDYLSALADYSGILADIIVDSLPESNAKLPESYFESPTSSFDGGPSPALSSRLAWLILVLLCKLDMKSEKYDDVSLSYLFLANNLQFIFEKVCTTRLRVILGEDWVSKHANKLRKYAANYETIAWNKVFSALPSMPLKEVSPEAAEECFRRFNAAFEESHRKQVSWIVPNENLRDALKVSIAKKLLPTYREVYGRYVGVLSGEDNSSGELVMFGPDDVENHLSDMFHGSSASDHETHLEDVCDDEVAIEVRFKRHCILSPWKKLRSILFG